MNSGIATSATSATDSFIECTITDERLTFFGGAAIAHTLLPDLHLSEDITLLARAPCMSIAEENQDVLVAALRS
ncbi:hypothetical protein ACWGJP_03505 [Microbacterium sp. NPDC055903]